MLFLQEKLAKVGPSQDLINEVMKKVKFSMREEMIKPNNRVNRMATHDLRKASERPTFVTRYCFRARKVFRIILQTTLASVNTSETNPG